MKLSLLIEVNGVLRGPKKKKGKKLKVVNKEVVRIPFHFDSILEGLI